MWSRRAISFFVPGLARSKGSKRAIPIYRGKKGQPKEFTGKSAVIESAGEGLKAWERDIRLTAASMMNGRPLFEGPMILMLCFTFLKPKSAPSHRLYPDRKPDLSKLLRAVEDCLSQIVFRDDAQIVEAHLAKRYGTIPGVNVRVKAVTVEEGK